MDNDTLARFAEWLRRPGFDGGQAPAALLEQAFAAGAAAERAAAGAEAAYCVFGFRTVLLAARQGREAADHFADHWNRKNGAALHADDRAYVQPVRVPERAACRPAPAEGSRGEHEDGNVQRGTD